MAKIEEFEVSISSTTAEGQQVQKRIIDLLEQSNFPSRFIFGVQLALEEAIVNAIKHGNRMDPAKLVRINCRLCEEKVRVVIEDEGAGFKPELVPDPTTDENLEKPGGRGIMLMRAFLSFVEYNEIGNRVTLEKWRSDE